MKLFEEFVKDGIIRKIAVNKERAKSLIEESDRKMISLKERLSKIGIKKENANDYIEYCYDIIMHLVRAKLYFNGFYASGIGAHEAEVSYLKVLKFSEKEVRFTDQMRYFRNGILYYGTCLDSEYAEKVVEFTKEMYYKLKNMPQQ